MTRENHSPTNDINDARENPAPRQLSAIIDLTVINGQLDTGQFRFSLRTGMLRVQYNDKMRVQVSGKAISRALGRYARDNWFKPQSKPSQFICYP
ncbi:hypothetical protein PoB_002879400 [Plakobranchus ocellatus]|uniref:Uncharacterized protein n=1 Tax=Plakobranchus ocellatus TaxID=259542 RepID=A0AAV4A6W6_9GAST|nr:hypothetical protein PoB_002879400 [Plakobranchus ocellatus]